MLDNVLPRAQAEFGRDAVRILAECYVQRIESDSRRATGAVCRLGHDRTITVRAKTVVVSAGAIASSALLARSRVGGAKVGSNLGFNIASPLNGDFDEVIHAERGLQICHYVVPPAGEGFVLETWFNPAGTQSLFMPGWFGAHRANMKRYPHMACLGSVVGKSGLIAGEVVTSAASRHASDGSTSGPASTVRPSPTSSPTVAGSSFIRRPS